VDVVESAARSLLSLHPDNPVTETGVLAEVRHHGVRSRLGQHRADLKHQWMDPFIVALPWAAAATGTAAAYRLAKNVVKRP
jgi:hypothetical protein